MTFPSKTIANLFPTLSVVENLTNDGTIKQLGNTSLIVKVLDE